MTRVEERVMAGQSTVVADEGQRIALAELAHLREGAEAVVRVASCRPRLAGQVCAWPRYPNRLKEVG